MRLLNVETERLEEFGDDIPAYTIFSHTWGNDEVTFEALTSNNYKHLQGYHKVRALCKVTRAEGYKYTWIDTCCIDKSSSAELSEAINSMFDWYKSAAICFAYLEDVHGYPGRGQHTLDQFKKSRWFTRGWTLQELIAPRMVILLNSSWKEIGTKSAPHWARLISEITGIDRNCLAVSAPYSNTEEVLATYSVAQKMSWAAKRNTTRVEDLAYCLMGLSNVKMPVLYGEGEKSFCRLQQEIMNISNDSSIFVWQLPRADIQPRTTYGLLAPNVRCFAKQGLVRPLNHTSRADARLFTRNTAYFVNKTNVALRVSTLGNLEPWDSMSKTQRQHFDNILTFSAEGASSKLQDSYAPDPNKTVIMLDCATNQARIGFVAQMQKDGDFGRADPNQLLLMNSELSLPPADHLCFDLYKRDQVNEENGHSYHLDFEESLGKWGYTCTEGVCIDQQTRVDLRSQYCGKHWRLFTPSGPTDGYPSILIVFCHTLGKAPEQLRRDTIFVGCEVIGRSLIDESNVTPMIHRVQLTSLHDTTEIRYKAFPTKHLQVKLRVAVPRVNTLFASLEDVDDEEVFDTDSAYVHDEVDDAASIATTLVEYRDWVFG